MQPCKFTFDDFPVFDGFAHGSTWNGFDNVAVTYDERLKIAEWMRAGAHVSDCVDEEVHDLLAIEPIDSAPDRPTLYSLGWGYATQIVREESPLPLPDNAADVIAQRFVTVLRAWLDADEWDLMGDRNAVETDPGVCHSHDFCDANMAMCEAFESVTGKTPDGDNEAEATLWGTAWANAMPYLTIYTAEWKAK